MKCLIVLFTALSAGLLPAQTIRGVVNAASFAPTGAPNAGVAPGSQIAILGTDIGPAEPVQATGFPYPTTAGLGGVTVKVAVGGASADAILLSVSATRVVAVVPSTVPVGAAQVSLTVGGVTVSGNVEIVATNFGVFTTTNSGSGPAKVKNIADNAAITFVAPARPGQQIALLGTGLGPVSGDEAAGPLAGDLATEVDVYVGGKKATVVSKGRTAEIGVDQVVFEVPADVTGCFVSVAVGAAGKISNFVTTSIAAEGTCSDPGGFTPADFERISVQTEFSSGGVTLSRSSQAIQTFETTSETASGSFSKIKIEGTIAVQNFGGNPSIGSCVVSIFNNEVNPISVDIQILDAGPALSLTGPKGPKQLTKQNGIYNATLSQVLPSIPGLPPIPGASGPYLDPGEYTVSGPGGDNVGAFSAKITLGPALTWTNRNTVGNDGANNINRSSDVTVTWTGGRDSETVSILGTSILLSPQVIGSFRCLERAPAGRFTVPAWVLSAIPPSPQGNLSLSLNSEPVRFEVTGVDTATLSATSSSGRSIAFR